jgi:hypothetical protein
MIRLQPNLAIVEEDGEDGNHEVEEAEEEAAEGAGEEEEKEEPEVVDEPEQIGVVVQDEVTGPVHARMCNECRVSSCERVECVLILMLC